MHRFYFSRLGLCEEAAELPAGNGGVNAPPAAAPGATQPPSTAPPVKAGVIDGAIAMFKDKGQLNAELKALRQTNADQAAQITGLQTQLATVTGERDSLRTDFTRLETALTAAGQEKKTVEQEVVTQLASAGVPELALPRGAAAAAATGPGTIDEQITALNDKIEKTADPKEKGRLANEVWALMKKPKTAALN